ncbi:MULTISPECIES: hypothetical protein [Cytobacillus]|uniref:hypothetical protein n=1 Tax=Cytobacillus TaxID=2675230 RepID=UPI000DEB48EA|nr:MULTISPECIES: hypothetical protein [Cytobacillus]
MLIQKIFFTEVIRTKKDINKEIENQTSTSQDILMDRVNQAFNKVAEDVRGMVAESIVKKNSR